MGFTDVYPAINSISSLKEHIVGKMAVRNCWDYTNGYLLMSGTSPFFHVLLSSNCPMTFALRVALLNWQWSRTGGPRTPEEQAILYTLVAAG